MLIVVFSADADRRRMMLKLRPAGGASSTLDADAYWKLDEGSGTTREDSGSNNQDLTDSGTTASAAAKINNGCDFEFSSVTDLSHADSATLSLGADTDFTIWAWVNVESDPGFAVGIISKEDAGDGTGDEYGLFSNAIGNFRFRVGNGSSSQSVDSASFSTATWYLIVCWHDSAADTLNIQVNNGTPVTAAWSGGTQNTGAAFVVGSRTYNRNLTFDGLIDEVGFKKRVFTADERTELYNSGNGKTCCPF